MPLMVPFCTVGDMEGKAVVTTGTDVWTVDSDSSAELDGTTCAVGSVSSVGIVTEN